MGFVPLNKPEEERDNQNHEVSSKLMMNNAHAPQQHYHGKITSSSIHEDVDTLHLGDSKLSPTSLSLMNHQNRNNDDDTNYNMKHNNSQDIESTNIIDTKKKASTPASKKRKDVARVAATRSRKRKKSWINELEQAFYMLKESNIIYSK